MDGAGELGDSQCGPKTSSGRAAAQHGLEQVGMYDVGLEDLGQPYQLSFGARHPRQLVDALSAERDDLRPDTRGPEPAGQGTFSRHYGTDCVPAGGQPADLVQEPVTAGRGRGYLQNAQWALSHA
jgi:hypothetical protein